MKVKLKSKKKIIPKKAIKEEIDEALAMEEVPKKRRRDIRDIVDYSRPFNIFYSGVEDEEKFNILHDMGINNFLISYHYVQAKRFNAKKFREEGVKFFIDSGAYTYQNDLKYQDTTVEEWEEHIKKYLNWARKNKDIIFAIANLDLENVVGEDIVKEWNEKYFEPFMLETEIPVCFIWHPVMGNVGWERYCQRYPYVGMSWVSDEGTDLDFNFGQSMLKVAEKYNTVVHGMGMTRTSLLTKLSFYTSDSTTWLVGLQYGEINYWNGQKMQRLKKDKWKGSYLDGLCTKYHLEKELLLAEDMTEMIKANVSAFIEAEEFIHQLAKSRFYWQKEKSNKRSENDIEDYEFPSIEWITGDRVGVENYAKEMNISTVDMEMAETLVIDMTCFMNFFSPEYEEYIDRTYSPELLKELHDTYVNRIVQSDDERIEDLIKFFKDCFLGENTTLLYLNTNFDRTVKEREENEYVTDDEYELEDVSEGEIKTLLRNALPSPLKEEDIAPEITEYDEMLEDLGIRACRDESGRFLKGQRKVKKPKNLYSNKYPKLACDVCINAQRCPEYKAGYACAYNKMFHRFNTRNMGDIIQAMQGITDLSMRRLQISMIGETLNGGMPDGNTTVLMNQSIQLLTHLQKLYETGSQEVIRQTKILRADGSREMTTQVSNPQSGGILDRLFSNLGSENKEEDFVEVPNSGEDNEE